MADVLNMYSQAGFYRATASKCFFGWIGLSHIVIQIPMFRFLKRYLIHNMTVSRGDLLGLFTSRLAFLDTKDAIFAAVLVYTFRIFERRWGTRRFCSRLISAFVFCTALEMAFFYVLTNYVEQNTISGLYPSGPFGGILPLFIPYFTSIPKLKSNGNVLLSSIMSHKIITYLVGVQIATASPEHLVTTVSALIAGVFIQTNILWCQKIFAIPKKLADIIQRIFGHWLDSSPPAEGSLGATLEIQRTQQMDAYEQQLIRQQARIARGGRNRRPQVGQGFAERLVEEDHGGFGAFGVPWGARQPAENQPQQAAPQQAVAPSEENIGLLMEMGFSRNQVENALRRSNNDVQVATTILLQEA